jgi:ligand-binding sensor domain-containing protein
LNQNRKNEAYLFLALAILHVGAKCSWALDKQPSASQYSRQQWSAEDGFRIGQVSSIAQTSDGYLWVGGENGLLSFDGERFHSFPSSGPLGITHVLGLTTDGHGALWIWMQGANILRYNRGNFSNVTNELGLSDGEITVLSTGTQGSVLLSTLGQEIFEYKDGSVREIGSSRVPNTLMLALAQSRDGRVWAGVRDYGLGYVEGGRVVLVSGNPALKKINCLLGHGTKALWVGTDNGLFLWNGSSLEGVPGPPEFSGSQLVAMVEDRDGNLWCGTDRGLFRVSQNASKQQTASGPLLRESVSALFQDRGGGLWIGAAGTLQRWNDFAFQPIKNGTGEGAGLVAPIYVDEQNSAWVASPSGGLYRVNQDHVERYRAEIFGSDVIYSLTGRNGDIWAGRRNGGITRLHRTSEGVTVKTFTTVDGLAQNAVFSVFEARNGAVWAGTLNSGLSRFEGNRWETFTTASGLPSNTISAISEDREGVLWVGTPNGLASFSDRHWHSYTVRDGLPSDDVSSILPDIAADGRSILWAGTAKGLALLRSGRIQASGSDSEILREPIWGLTEDADRHLWVATPDHLARVSRNSLLNENVKSTNVRLYGRQDGIEQPGSLRRTRCLVTDSSGKVWAGTKGGLRVTTAAYVRHRAVPTIVDIESIVTDAGAADIRSPRVPAPQRRIVFNYNGLNFAAPDRIRFRYRLDGYDKDWNDPVAVRQAVYTNLDPATYRFRLIASNSEGEWSSNEASVSLQIEPALWQTWWFRSLCLIASAVLVWCVYTFRTRQIAAKHSLIFEGRVAERMRIAQDLHDTLLQSFHALMLRFQAVSNMLPNQPDNAKELLDTAIDRAAEALTESRHAVQKLRTPSVGSTDLAEVLTRLGDELRDAHSSLTPVPSFRVLVEGVPQTVNPLVRDDLYRIGREAIGNAFRHAHARQVEVELLYERDTLALRVRDDGVGMESRLVARGRRDGHWGLPGMRERTRELGGRFTVWSELRQGTEIEASIPGRVAYRVIDDVFDGDSEGT